MKEVAEAVGMFMVHTIGPIALAIVVGIFLYSMLKPFRGNDKG